MRSAESNEGGPERLAGAGPRSEGSTFPQRDPPPPAEADGRAGDGLLGLDDQRELRAGELLAEADGRAVDGLLGLDDQREVWAGEVAVLLLGLDDQRGFWAGELALETLLPRPLR